MDVVNNRRVWLVAGPSLALLIMAVVLPERGPGLAGAAFAWALVVTLLFRSQERMEYQAAIRHMRRGEFEQAVRVMNTLINAEPDSLAHRRFRSELYWLHGDLQSAAVDYEWMTTHHLGRVFGNIGLAEIAMHQGDLDRARDYALTAFEHDKGWMAAYDLGLIEDRLGSAESAVKYLEAAFTSAIPHNRFRLLARLWLARNYHRLGRDDDVRTQIALMQKETKGARDWQVIFESEQGVLLRDLFEADVRLAQQLLKAETTLEALD